MKKFSIIIPTRTRIKHITNLLKSIYDSTIEPQDVEIHVLHDNDDTETQAFVDSRLQTTPPVETFFHKRERSKNISTDYYNWAALNFATGEYIIISNDDALFELVGWDKRAKDKLDNVFKPRYPDGLLYAFTEDYEHEPSRQQHNWMACFPLISKKAVEVMGCVFDPSYVRDGADWALAALFRSIDRVVDLRDCIWIRHISHRSGRRQWDELDEYSKRLGIAPPPLNTCLEGDIRKKLINHIHGVKNENIPSSP